MIFQNCFAKGLFSLGAFLPLFSLTESECFILSDLKTGKVIQEIGGDYCYKQMPPCSTFKVPLAAMAFETQAIRSPQDAIPWDGKPKMLKTWEQNQTPQSWMEYSTVWVSQYLVSKMGKGTVENFLKKFQYGNANFSGEPMVAWLSFSPTSPSEGRASVKISAHEQVRFLSALWNNQLPISGRSQKLTQELTRLFPTASGSTLYGKTGSGYAGKRTKKRMGWFIAKLAYKGTDYVGVEVFEDTKPPPNDAGFAGPEAREKFIAHVKKIGLY